MLSLCDMAIKSWILRNEELYGKLEKEKVIKLMVVQVDLSQYALPVLTANVQELAAHEELLVQLDKSSGGKTVWRQAQAA